MTVKQLMTAEELWEMPEKPGVRFELVEGEVIEMPGLGALAALIVGRVYNLVHASVQEQRLGLVFLSGLGYLLHRRPDVVRLPTCSFLSWDRIPEELPDGYWPGAPDLAVEVVSPSDTVSELGEKVDEYAAAGVRAVWIVDPANRTVTVHETGRSVRILREGDVLDGGEVVPGFQFPVVAIFADIRRK